MRLPRTSRPQGHPTAEVVLGMGDYAAGGSHSLPFLDLDGARRRRPLVFGEVACTLDGYPDLAADMFSGRHSDPAEWAVMWREIGADGITLRLGDLAADADRAAALVSEVATRSRLPVHVCGCGDDATDIGLMRTVAGRVDGTTLILDSDGPEMSMELSGTSGRHAVVARAHDAEELMELTDAMSHNTPNIISRLDTERLGDGINVSLCELEAVRAVGVSGRSVTYPQMADVTGAWESDLGEGGYESVRKASLLEAASALAVMLSGADIVVVRGPGAADMARVYGEELADL